MAMLAAILIMKMVRMGMMVLLMLIWLVMAVAHGGNAHRDDGDVMIGMEKVVAVMVMAMAMVMMVAWGSHGHVF